MAMGWAYISVFWLPLGKYDRKIRPF